MSLDASYGGCCLKIVPPEMASRVVEDVRTRAVRLTSKGRTSRRARAKFSVTHNVLNLQGIVVLDLLLQVKKILVPRFAVGTGRLIL